MMQKKFLEKIKAQLEKEKVSVENELKKFAKEDVKPSGDWDTRFPKFNGGEAGSAALEKAADEVEEYSTLLPIEHALEIRLKNINSALEKIRIGKYGICEKCEKKIPIARLKASPEARFCLKCEK
jgi:RNA polymerase-binding transcription factor DksA